MARVGGVGFGAGGIGGARPPAASAGGFFVAGGSGASGTGAAAAAAAAAAPGAVDGLLALQEMGGDRVRDRDARRHGEAMLRLLGALQRARLGADGEGGETRAELERLLGGCPDAADPGLRRLVAAVALRARVELARGTG